MTHDTSGRCLLLLFLLDMSVELAVAVIAAVVALISAAISLYGQVRIAKYQGEVAREVANYQGKLTQEVESQKFLQSHYADIGAYCIEQNAALREAYLDFFERRGGLGADGAAVGRLASKVDSEVMGPLGKYGAIVDERTRGKIYEIHNVIAQLRGNPSPNTINNFKSFRNDFYALIEEARDLLKPSGVLSRTGIGYEKERGSS